MADRNPPADARGAKLGRPDDEQNRYFRAAMCGKMRHEHQGTEIPE
jgi:hypothetical protein